MRRLGMDVHRDFCEVAAGEKGRIRSAGRVLTRVRSLEVMAQSLLPDDVVVVEAEHVAQRSGEQLGLGEAWTWPPTA